ncbi:MAG: 3-methylornithyl-N6-L-lysine dehydrogenase PylD [Deltaproteobacteria bacterium]|jgi:pyrrolysine biosynthesis protein PylD|nr:3-methylornithyl-N6-L-lysine dehydrogenase PylD [Deltaproteobacteria bacterium]
MTRLLPSDIAGFGADWSDFDRALKSLAGASLPELALGALDFPLDKTDFLAGKLVAVVPDSSGGGVIPGFSESLARVAGRLGARAVVAPPDAPGLRAAADMGADLILTSDDDSFVCRNVKTGLVSHNGPATGLGFAQALLLMAGGSLADRDVLVVGAGEVGGAAAARLESLGASVTVYDIVSSRAGKVADGLSRAQVLRGGIETRLADFELVLEASTSAEVWPEEAVRSGARLAAPGMPFSFVPSPRYGLWSEPLATGTAVMLAWAALGAGK